MSVIERVYSENIPGYLLLCGKCRSRLMVFAHPYLRCGNDECGNKHKPDELIKFAYGSCVIWDCLTLNYKQINDLSS